MADGSGEVTTSWRAPVLGHPPRPGHGLLPQQCGAIGFADGLNLGAKLAQRIAEADLSLAEELKKLIDEDVS